MPELPPEQVPTRLAATTSATRAEEHVESSSDPEGQPFGRYRLLEKLGQGGMGQVWKAYDTQLRRVVALKQIRPDKELPSTEERFRREAQAAARLRHPHIISVLDDGVIDGHLYLTTEYIEGRSLDDVIAAQPLPPKKAVELVKQIAEALAYAHDAGIVHRDLKPANILVNAGGKALVMDFGLAKDMTGELGRRLTASGDEPGTPPYKSPEQALARSDALGPPSDQFSLGVMLYELLTGKLPFDGTSELELVTAIVKQDPVAPSRVNPLVHRDLETICLKALEKDPLRRYASMAALAADLGRWLEGEPISARPVSIGERLWRKASRHRRVVVPVAGAAIVSIVLGALWWLGRGDLKQTGRQLEEVRRQADLDLDRSKKVQAVFSAFNDHLNALIEMERVFRDQRLSMDEKRRRNSGNWREFEEYLAAAGTDSASQATAKALAGWARRMAGYEDEGVQWMQEAARVDGDVPYGALMEAVVCLSNYVAQQTRPDAIEMFNKWTTGRWAPPQEEAAELVHLRKRILSLLDKASRARVWDPLTADHLRAAVEGIRSMQRGSLTAAEEGLSKGLQTTNLQLFRTDLLVARAQVRCKLARGEQAVADLRKVEEAWPDAASLFLHCALLRFAASREVGPDQFCEDVGVAAREGIRFLDEAIRLRPTFADAHAHRGFLLSICGWEEDRRSDDPRSTFKRAIADFDAALRLDSNPMTRPLSLRRRGDALRSLADAELDEGDARAGIVDCEKALRDFDESIAQSSDDSMVFLERGRAHLCLGAAREPKGTDERLCYERAIADFTKRLKSNGDAYYDRGNAYLRLAATIERSGEDASDQYKCAIADYNAAITRDPYDTTILPYRAEARLGIGDLAGCIEDSEKAVAQDPRSVRAWRMRGRARILTDAPGAVSDFSEAIELDGKDSLSYQFRGVAYQLEARHQMMNGADASTSLDSAVADFEQALQMLPPDAPARRQVMELLEVTSMYQSAPSWCLDVYRAQGEMLRQSYLQARRLYESALLEAERDKSLDPSWRDDIMNAHYNLACICAVNSTGKPAPAAEPGAISATESARLRDDAFIHLRKAVDHGWKDRLHVERDPDLLPLHEDLRWKEFLGRLAK